MAETIYTRKGNFKGLLFIFGLLIISVILFYTQNLVNVLQEQSREYLRFKIRLLEENINNPDSEADLGLFFEEVIQGTDYPVIYTDTSMVPIGWKNISKEIDTISIVTPQINEKLAKLIDVMDSENQAIPIQYQGIVLNYYHYGVSPVIKKLRWLPYFEIAIAILFILVGYIGFSQIKRSEQRYIWIGMAKETAHQLGTPISSIAGWIELLKENPEQVQHTMQEMEIDATRLTKIASRFSQIGSMPSLRETNLVPIIQNAVAYIRKRLPQYEKKIDIREVYQSDLFPKLNTELFEWVIENIVKNAIDAIEGKNGVIDIHVQRTIDTQDVKIDIKDSGKGITKRDRRNIFKPGFSTKARGWGLGLSLAKRIVEDYHGGKLFIKDTRLGEGTTFRIVLRNRKNQQVDNKEIS
jgi:anti-sigma regulatory factor (Ser/Thr protein kinase)